MNSLYLVVNLASFIIPLIFSFHPKLAFYRRWKYAFPAILMAASLFIIWDILYTQMGVWGFNPQYVLGVYFFNLPVEEVMFFICIPYSCLFTAHCFQILIKKDYLHKFENLITGSLLIFLLICIMLYSDKLYTLGTFAGLAALLLCLKFWIKSKWLGRFYFSYLVLLLPFFIVNGILTGTGPDEPVVWYNDEENMSVRILTIPLEDFFYGMFLILLNTTIYRYLERKDEILK